MSVFDIDWWEVLQESEKGTLLRYMREHIPREYWNDVDAFGYEESLLHYACRGPNIDVILVLVKECSMDVDIQDDEEETPLYKAFYGNQPQVAEVLLVLGAQMISPNHYIPWVSREMETETAKVLIANGLRIKNVTKYLRDEINGKMTRFDQGVVQCRDVIVTLLGLKKRRQHDGRSLVLPKLDRFLIKEVLAVEIWSTRSNENTQWQ